MVFVRKRYYFWLFKAYLKRWNKTILTSLVIGAAIFFSFIALLNLYIIPHLEKKTVKIGYSGVYTSEDLPRSLLSEVSYGLVRVDETGNVLPAAAEKWEIKNNGKEYVFHLRKGQFFHNGEEFTTKTLSLSFKDVKKTILDDYTVSFSLKDPYAPFLVSASKPLFRENFSGLGKYILKKIELNGGFIKSITLMDSNDTSKKKLIYFYPSSQALKLAFLLGDVDLTSEVSNTQFKYTDLNTWKNVQVQKKTDYSVLVTLFYNNEDSILSDKKIRQALNFALPEKFPQGERAYSPIPEKSIYFFRTTNYGITDIEIAKTFLSSTTTEIRKIEISTSPDFLPIAAIVKESWKKLGIDSEIKIVKGIPTEYQILLYEFKVPNDPDQYTLWHSKGTNNIVRYRKNLRIDKLLEDGRQNTNIDERIKLYADFQKYLLDDIPASFLFFPYHYVIARK